MTQELVDVAVVGAGPAGMGAAVQAADWGCTVAVIDSCALPGGQYHRTCAAGLHVPRRTGEPAAAPGPNRGHARADPRFAALVRAGRIRLIAGVTIATAQRGSPAPATSAALAAGDPAFVLHLVEVAAPAAPRSAVQARALVIATGATDRVLPFTGCSRRRPGPRDPARTCGQLRAFAAVVGDGSHLDLRVDRADPGAHPPRPDLRRMHVPIGPVAVFGASNFPLAFGVPGGDTASALAASCPVVAKAHPSHPATSELAAGAIAAAVRVAGLPDATFALLHGRGPRAARCSTSARPVPTRSRSMRRWAASTRSWSPRARSPRGGPRSRPASWTR